jgi:hypothetical protein
MYQGHKRMWEKRQRNCAGHVIVGGAEEEEQTIKKSMMKGRERIE